MPARRPPPVARPSTPSARPTRSTAHALSEQEVRQEIASNGLEYHPIYDTGLERLSCVYCVLAGPEWLGVITQRFSAPAGFVFTGRPVFGYYGTVGGVTVGELEYELYDTGRTLVIRANPHLNTAASETGSLVCTIPLRALPGAGPGMVTDGSASIGRHPALVRLLAKVL
ncbi:hypothetical protein [Streptomyces collinus]|uniref:hypothetical protein n=1 Tax=Streptomyces collinus TaxID=42684 RepID=UPI0029435DAD|nr:hypothetical protein [Streptomyces collinus]